MKKLLSSLLVFLCLAGNAWANSTPLMASSRNTNLSTTSGYYPLLGAISASGQTTENRIQIPVPTHGYFRNLRVHLSATATAATVTFRKAAGNTLLAVSMADPEVDKADTTHSIECNAGDLVDLYITASGTPGLPTWGLEFYSDTTGETICMGGTNGSISADSYSPLTGTITSATIANMQIPVPVAGTFKNLYVHTNTAILTGTWDIYLSLDGSDQAGLHVAMTSGTSGSDTGAGQAATAGQLACIHFKATSSPTTAYFTYAMVFVSSDNLGQFILGANHNAQSPVNSAESFCGCDQNNPIASWGTNDQAKQISPIGWTAKNIYARTTTGPGSGKHYYFGLNVNNNAWPPAFYTDNTGTSNPTIANASGSISVAAGNFVCYHSNPSGTPTASSTMVSLSGVTTVAPTVTTQAATAITDTTATLHGNVTVNTGTVSAAGFYISSVNNPPTVADTTVSSSDYNSAAAGTGAFTGAATSLSANTTYHCVAFATNEAGTTVDTSVVDFKTNTVLTSDPLTLTLSFPNATPTELKSGGGLSLGLGVSGGNKRP